MSLFKRRVELPKAERLREFLWPRQGLGRTLAYWRHRLVRLPGTPHSVAASVAAGISMSFMPPGLHLLMAAGLAVLTRGSALAATLVSIAFGNPVMTALLIAVDFGLGELLLGGRHKAVGSEIGLLEFFRQPLVVLSRFGLPFMVGAVLLAVLSWVVTYWLSVRFIEFAHDRRAKRLRRKWEQRQGAKP